MDPDSVDFAETTAASKRFVRRLFAIGENRLELLVVELQEERERLMRAIMLALGVAGFGFLAGISLTALLIVLFWKASPEIVLSVVTLIYSGAAFCLYRRLKTLLTEWQMLEATLDQLRKDRECLEKNHV